MSKIQLWRKEKKQKDKGNAVSKNTKARYFKAINIICIFGLILFSSLFINEVFLQPYRVKESIEQTRALYKKQSEPDTSIVPSIIPSTTVVPTASLFDSQGRLLQFHDLLTICPDVKGWLSIPETDIDYVVAQGRADDPNYYLDKDLYGNYSKAGTLYLDLRGSIEADSKNLVIHGHNMVSTKEKMFHSLLEYKKTSYYKEHPVISFDTLYSTGLWKVFAVFISNGSDDKEPLFDYRKATFNDSSEFLNFVYQIRIRSLLNTEVDIQEDDQILCLSTCSYEVDDYRTVVVARKVRPGEAPTVEVEEAESNPAPLFPASYYYRYGGEAPALSNTFEDAYANGEISWYK